MTLPAHIPGTPRRVPIARYFEYLRANGLQETGEADKRVFDPRIKPHGAYIPAIVYVTRPSTAGGLNVDETNNQNGLNNNKPAGLLESENQ